MLPTDTSYEVNVPSGEREPHVFSHFGCELEMTQFLPYQFPFFFDFDLLLRIYTWDWILNHMIIKNTLFW